MLREELPQRLRDAFAAKTGRVLTALTLLAPDSGAFNPQAQPRGEQRGITGWSAD
ncbi:MAG: hypothetical protein AAGC72_17735 [Planctomycetota bacterium]